MNLLLDEIDVLETSGDPTGVDVTGVEHDSRRVRRGDLFCCLPGTGADGHDFAAAAVGRGAVGLLCEHFVEAVPVAQARVAPGGARPAMARAAAAFYGHPARSLVMAGVTGTNGKTTVTHLLGAVLSAAEYPITVLGTLSGARTTPEATDLQRRLAELRDAGDSGGPRPAVAMEVSSHALAQSRVDTIRFDVAVFTNLSHDHLDYHGSMESYFAAKASLFAPERAVRAVVNADDPWGRRLIAAAAVPLHAVHGRDASEVLVRAGSVAFTWRGQRVTCPLTGAVNVQNALLAAEAAIALGLEPAQVARGLAAARPVPGRLEVVAGPELDGTGFVVVVDYAHTPAALDVLLDEAHRLARPAGRVIAVFGCGGERDRAKRPLMGATAAAGSELAVLTSDNPRGEDPGTIIDQVRAGVPDAVLGAGGLVVEPDRRRAIALALASAGPGDVVVVAGKGHEDYQEVGGQRLPFDDRSVVSELLGHGRRGA
jgi:UDP-N-acetylmuramoyl-L-alanyl-D-glutamate--2,6-diaminopimelate ligase